MWAFLLAIFKSLFEVAWKKGTDQSEKNKHAIDAESFSAEQKESASRIASERLDRVRGMSVDPPRVD